MPDRNLIAAELGQMAIVRARQGRAAEAARLAGASGAIWAIQGRTPWEDVTLDTLLPGWRDGPDRAAIEAAFSEGRAMDTEQAVAFALAGGLDPAAA